MPKIDYYFSTISPYTYLAGDQLEQIAEKHGAEIVYKPLDIVALFGRTGGTPPAQRHENRQAYRAKDLLRVSKLNGLDLNLKPAFFPTNAAPSSYAVIAAQAAGTGDVGALVRALLTSVWGKEQNIAEDEVIRACLTEAGFDAALADSGLLSGAETYAANLEEAVACGAFGAPFYVVGDEPFWGQDRLAHLDAHLSGDI
jgi:2-hydroxychromene-2-carboxylate isomerase